MASIVFIFALTFGGHIVSVHPPYPPILASNIVIVLTIHRSTRSNVNSKKILKMRSNRQMQLKLNILNRMLDMIALVLILNRK